MNWQEHLKKLSEEKIADNIENKLWRIENLYPITNKQGVRVPFKLNNLQKKVLLKLSENPENPLVILKARQVGITTLFGILYLDDVLIYEGVRAAIQSHKHESMNDIFSNIRASYDYAHPCLKEDDVDARWNKKQRHTKTEIEIPSLNSKIEVKLEVRSIAINRIHFSEFAFIEDKRIASTEGSVTKDAIKVYESTAYGINKFYDLYMKEKEKGNTLFFGWNEHQEYYIPTKKIKDVTPQEVNLRRQYNLTDSQLQFRRNKLASLTDREFKTEFPINDIECFSLSGNSVVEPQFVLEKLNIASKKNYEHIIDGNIRIKIFKKYTYDELKKNPLRFYVGADPAEGVGQDYSCVSLITVDDLGNMEVIMTMRGQIEPVIFAQKIFFYLKKYYIYEDPQTKNVFYPQIIVERNNHGHAVLACLEGDIMYPNLYIHKDARIGFLTTAVSKKNMLRQFFSAFTQNEITITDEVILQELLTLVIKESGNIEAEEGKHDDMIMATALAFWGYFFEIKDQTAFN